MKKCFTRAKASDRSRRETGGTIPKTGNRFVHAIPSHKPTLHPDKYFLQVRTHVSALFGKLKSKPTIRVNPFTSSAALQPSPEPSTALAAPRAAFRGAFPIRHANSPRFTLAPPRNQRPGGRTNKERTNRSLSAWPGGCARSVWWAGGGGGRLNPTIKRLNSPRVGLVGSRQDFSGALRAASRGLLAAPTPGSDPAARPYGPPGCGAGNAVVPFPLSPPSSGGAAHAANRSRVSPPRRPLPPPNTHTYTYARTPLFRGRSPQHPPAWSWSR